MNNVTQGISQLLWFIHRTIFELVPAILLDVFVYFLCQDFIEKNPSLLPGWLAELRKFFLSDGHDFLVFVFAFSIVMVTHLLLEAGSTVLCNPHNKKCRENIEIYPNYLLYKDKINAELKPVFGEPYSFNPQEIVSVMRYKIMEEHKEFNTYLWYITTGTTTLGNLKIALMIVCVLFTPVLSFDFNATTNFLRIYYPFLVLTNGFIIWVFQNHFLKEKISEINKWETKNNSVNENLSFFEIGKWDIAVLLTAIVGYILFSIKINHTSFCYDFLKNFISSSGITFLLLPLIYMIIVYRIIESKRFGKKMLDAFISIRYDKELFNLKLATDHKAGNLSTQNEKN